MNHYRNILLIWAGIFLFSLSAVSQPTLLNETRIGRTEKYSVCPSLPNSTFQWTVVQGGSVVRQSNTQPCDTLVINWGLQPGSYNLEVTEISQLGCFGQPFIGMILVKDALPPVASPDINFSFPSATISGSVATNDYSLSHTPDNLFYTLLSAAPPGFTFNADGSYTYTPPTPMAAPIALNYRVCYQSRPANCSQSVLWIYPVTGIPNQPPFATVDYGVAFEGGQLNGSLLSNDFETGKNGIVLNTTLLANVAHGTLSLYPDGAYRYTPNTGYIGNDSFTYEISNALNPSQKTSATVLLDVRKKEDDLTNLPTNVVDDAYFTDGVAIAANLAVNDYNPDADNLTYTANIGSGPNHGTLALNNDGTFNYMPNAGYEGVDKFVYTVCDNGKPQFCQNSTAYFVVSKPIENLAANASTDQSIGFCQSAALDGTASTGKLLTYKWTTIDVGGELTDDTNVRPTFKLSPTYTGTLPATFRVQLLITDNVGATDKDTVAITVDASPQSIIKQIGYADQNGRLVLDGSSSTGNTLTYKWSTFNGQIVGADDQPTATAGKEGNYMLVVTDKYGCQSQQTIVPEFVEHVLIANDDYARISWIDTARIVILENDYDSHNDIDVGSVRITVQPKLGDARVNADGTVTYSPKGNKAGRDKFIYEVCDSTDLCNDGTVTIDLYDVSVRVVQGFSPNGDGMNDYLEFEGVDKYPGSELTVFTREGQEVYYSDNYQNDWDGKVLTKYTKKHDLVPIGVYYYTLRLGGDNKRTIKGYIYIGY